MLRVLDRAARDVGNAALDAYGAWRAKSYDLENTIAVACTGRGGSSWLAQMLGTLPGYHILWEQLHWRTNPESTSYGFGYPVYIPSGAEAPTQQRYLEHVLRGRKLSAGINSSRYFQPLSLLLHRGYVVKFVNANMLLPWMTETFPVRAVFMIRHPCAVVSSQLVHGAWDGLPKEHCYHEELFERHPHLSSIYERIDAIEERLAFNWAVQNFVPLSSSSTRWITTSYERLVTDELEEVKRLFEGLGESVPRETEKMFHRPSATTVESSNVAQDRNPLTGWTERLRPAQIDTILSVVQDVGIEAYSNALEPDYDLLL